MYGVLCDYGSQVMEFEPASIIRPSPVNTANFFDPLVTVLTGFHCISRLLNTITELDVMSIEIITCHLWFPCPIDPAPKAIP